jgi:hypothetical protein
VSIVRRAREWGVGNSNNEPYCFTSLVLYEYNSTLVGASTSQQIVCCQAIQCYFSAMDTLINMGCII